MIPLTSRSPTWPPLVAAGRDRNPAARLRKWQFVLLLPIVGATLGDRIDGLSGERYKAAPANRVRHAPSQSRPTRRARCRDQPSEMAAYLHDIWRCRYFWLSLIQLDLRTRYRGSGLGVGWSLLRPLTMTAILCAVFHELFQVDIREYCPYLLIGFAGWNFLSSVALEGCSSLLLADAYIRQHRAPLAIYPLRTALGAAVHLLLALLVVLVLLTCFRGFGDPLPLLTLAPGLILLFLFGWSAATIAALVNVHFRDAQHLCDVALQMLFYLTPVIYPARMLQQRSLGWLVNYNPLACFLELLRAPLLENQSPSAAAFGIAAVTVAAAAGTAVVMLTRMQRRIVFYL